jgi:L-seryl-tRNA(Ser) seleniumtransferase
VAVAGAGSVPGLDIPSAGVELDGDHTASLRADEPPVIARLRKGNTVLDLRTIEPADDEVVRKACQAVLG